MEENVITIPVYATMANHLCRPSLHLKKPDSKCCWTAGAQKLPLLRLPNQCLALALRQEKRVMSQSSLKTTCVYLDVNVYFSSSAANVCFPLDFTTLLHKKKKYQILKMIHGRDREQHYTVAGINSAGMQA